MLHIVLVEPEIPQNCGNIARTCAATGSRLHLVRPLGFDISDRAVRRAGLDYWHLVEVFDYADIHAFFAAHPDAMADGWLATTKAPRDYTCARFHRTAGCSSARRRQACRRGCGSGTETAAFVCPCVEGPEA